MTTEREPGPVWASFEDWWGEERISAMEGCRKGPTPKDAWHARDAEIDALKAENQALRARLVDVEAAAQAVWDAKSQSGDAIAAWTRLIDVLDGSAER